eukprot:6177846-Pleurochrysis_carterae.AAC.3
MPTLAANEARRTDSVSFPVAVGLWQQCYIGAQCTYNSLVWLIDLATAVRASVSAVAPSPNARILHSCDPMICSHTTTTRLILSFGKRFAQAQKQNIKKQEWTLWRKN